MTNKAGEQIKQKKKRNWRATVIKILLIFMIVSMILSGMLPYMVNNY